MHRTSMSNDNWVCYMQLEAVVRRIKRLIHKDPAAKVLVFSSWQDVLELVSHALQTNALPFAYAKGRQAFDQAISQFKRPAASAGTVQQGIAVGPNLQILLLLIKQGANGLNLTGNAHSNHSMKHHASNQSMLLLPASLCDI